MCGVYTCDFFCYLHLLQITKSLESAARIVLDNSPVLFCNCTLTNKIPNYVSRYWQKIAGLELREHELREEVVQANQLRKQQLVELGLLREEEKQKMQRDQEIGVHIYYFIFLLFLFWTTLRYLTNNLVFNTLLINVLLFSSLCSYSQVSLALFTIILIAGS